MGLDLDALLTPVAGDDPAGENKEYDPLYMRLEEFALGRPASAMGDSVVEGVDPDWRALRKSCLALWERTRDLRVAMYLCVAEFSLDGLKGFSEALSVVRYLVSEHWDRLYPRLDPDDDNDPTERLNILSMISPAQGSYNDPLMFVGKFRTARLVEGKRYTLRDLLIVNGEIDRNDANLDPVLFQGEMRAVMPAVMEEGMAVIDGIAGRLADIAGTVNGRLTDGAVSFATLMAEVKVLQRFYRSHVPQPDARPDEAGEEAASLSDGQDDARPPERPARRVDIAEFVPGNRSEALLLLRKGADYFRLAEPTSPVPLLVGRALRMADMSFLDLLGDIEPGALEKGREIFGVRPGNGD